MFYARHIVFVGDERDMDEDIILEGEAAAIGQTVGDLADFRAMFGIAPSADDAARGDATGREVFLAGAISQNHVPGDIETCID